MTLADPGFAGPASDAGGPLEQAREQAAAAWSRAAEVLQATEQIVAESQAVRQMAADARRERLSSAAGRERMRRSRFIRLLARMETMPVIEQAKGIIMAQSSCGEAEAFDILRRASQRYNVPVRDLAAQIVARAAARGGPAAPVRSAAPRPDRQNRRRLLQARGELAPSDGQVLICCSQPRPDVALDM